MSELRERIRNLDLHAKITTAEATIPLFRDGMYLAFSGFAGGHPKAVPHALANHVEKNNLQGQLRFNVMTGASIGRDVEDRWSALDMTDRRSPYQASDVCRNKINAGKIRMNDKHLSMFAQELSYGFHTLDNDNKIDLVLIEASDITEDGGIILTGAVGICPEAVQFAERIIIEINTAVPSFEGMHDIVMPELPPHKQPYLITKVDDRIGTTALPCDPNKIVAIVESKDLGIGRPLPPPKEDEIQIAQHIIDFFQFEVKEGRLPKDLLPLQSGVGQIANAVLGCLVDSPFDNLQIWTEVMQDTALDLFDSGKLKFVSGASFALSNEGLERFYANWHEYKEKVVLRPAQISNHPELVRRLGIIAMNTPVEFDIYAHVNSSLVNGSKMINGIGGAGDFSRNAYLSMMHSPSTRPTKTDPTGISCVVPKVTHVDQTEHDMDVLVTEQGLADLRGLCPRERAQKIIDKCVHPDYRPIIQDYFDRATREGLAKGAAHEPHMLYKVFRMQQNLEEKGTMKIDSWD
jgi:acetyl-CoA hydrolase